MVVTMEHILAVLHPYEPDYSNASTMGPEALPHLETIVKREGPLLASKAAYLASFIQDERSIAVLESAARSNYPEVRVTAVVASKNLHIEAVDNVLELLKNDQDQDVRAKAIKSIESRRQR